MPQNAARDQVITQNGFELYGVLEQRVERAYGKFLEGFVCFVGRRAKYAFLNLRSSTIYAPFSTATGGRGDVRQFGVCVISVPRWLTSLCESCGRGRQSEGIY
jgi:hypothetical protein